MGVYLGTSIYNDSQVTEAWVKEQIEKNGKGVFWALYNETTFEEIETAVNEGKTVICIYEETENIFYYGLLEHFDDVGETAIFTALDYSKSLKQWSMISNVWYYQEKSLLPSVNAEDNEKVLTVKDGQLQLDYLPVGKFGLETPLIFKKDTLEETVIGFQTTSSNYLDILRVDKSGEPKFEPLPFVLLGIESPLKFNEDDTKTVIEFDTTQSKGMFLCALPTAEGGGVGWKYAAQEMAVKYDSSLSKWVLDNCSYQDIVRAVNYHRAVYVRMEASTNNFFVMPLVWRYIETVDNVQKWVAVFNRVKKIKDTVNNIYVIGIDEMKIFEDETIEYNSYYQGQTIA